MARTIFREDVGRRQFIRACMASLAMATAGCSRRDDPAYGRGSTVVVAVSDPSILRPGFNFDVLIFLPLAQIDDKGELVPRLAAGWEHSTDYREWTYHLRRGVRWHDGTLVTAEDVKFSIDLRTSPDVAEYPPFDSVIAVNDSTVKIRGRLGYQDYLVFYPKHLLHRLDPKRFWQWEFWTHPVGNGPYRFVQYVPDTMIEYQANPDYYGPRPAIKKLVLKFAGKSGLTELLSGNVDIVLNADPMQIPRVMQDSRFRVYYSISGEAARSIFWNCDHPLFRDVRVRRALTLALDRRELIRVVNLPQTLPITDGVYTLRQFRHGQLAPPLPYDPQQAGALLDGAGWRERDADGFRRRQGQALRFTAIVPNGEGNDWLAVYVQAMLRRVGAQMEIRMMDWNSVFSKFIAGDFESAFMFLQTGSDTLIRDFGAGNHHGYRNLEAFRIIEELRNIADPDKLDHMYAALTEILRADLPFTRLYPAEYTHFVHRRIQGLRTPFHADPDQFMDDLWIEEKTG